MKIIVLLHTHIYKHGYEEDWSNNCVMETEIICFLTTMHFGTKNIYAAICMNKWSNNKIVSHTDKLVLLPSCECYCISVYEKQRKVFYKQVLLSRLGSTATVEKSVRVKSDKLYKAGQLKVATSKSRLDFLRSRVAVVQSSSAGSWINLWLWKYPDVSKVNIKNTERWGHYWEDQKKSDRFGPLLN